MLFVYPAIISDKVSKTYLPGIIKTLELYFLDKIVTDIASKTVNLYVTQNRFTGKYSEVRMEHTLLCENLGYDQEEVNKILTENRDSIESIQQELEKLRQDLEKKDKELEIATKKLEFCKDTASSKEKGLIQSGSTTESPRSTYQPQQRDPQTGRIISRGRWARDTRDITRQSEMHPDIASRHDITGCKDLYEEVGRLAAEYRSIETEIRAKEKQLEVVQRSASEQEKAKLKYDYDVQKIKDEEERAKKYSTVGGAEGLRLDSQLMLDLRPTSTVMSVSLEVRKKKLTTVISDVDEARRDIPISVKVVPIIASNFNDIYASMTKDYFSNKFSQIFKAATRKMMSGGLKFLGPVAKKLLRQTKDPRNIDTFRDIIMGKTGIINSGQFKRVGSGGKSDRFSSSIVIFGADDVKDEDKMLFKDPDKLQTLYYLGWKVFAIADDKDQKLDLCSGLEGGAMCTSIPYSHAYKSLQADDLFKDADQLSRFTSRVIGNFKRTNYRKLTAEQTMIQLMTEQRVRTLYEKFGGK